MAAKATGWAPAPLISRCEGGCVECDGPLCRGAWRGSECDGFGCDRDRSRCDGCDRLAHLSAVVRRSGVAAKAERRAARSKRRAKAEALAFDRRESGASGAMTAPSLRPSRFLRARLRPFERLAADSRTPRRAGRSNRPATAPRLCRQTSARYLASASRSAAIGGAVDVASAGWRVGSCSYCSSSF